MYYHDPDGNTIETQYDTMEMEAASAYMEGPAFRENPIGVDFDPEELIERIKSGESLESLIKRKDIGPRSVDSIPG